MTGKDSQNSDRSLWLGVADLAEQVMPLLEVKGAGSGFLCGIVALAGGAEVAGNSGVALIKHDQEAKRREMNSVHHFKTEKQGVSKLHHHDVGIVARKGDSSQLVSQPKANAFRGSCVDEQPLQRALADLDGSKDQAGQDQCRAKNAGTAKIEELVKTEEFSHLVELLFLSRLLVARPEDSGAEKRPHLLRVGGLCGSHLP
ncbi:hypothetical protein BDK51DRAFT_34475 [Blyttiomyces helicus]|uniref:Uncharacterized protein n=1 Tax=Blyttiomyces helicus TaxID=388810 RepID=A0A4P9W1W4_9FUNG|nr:hypothetical protein BDK51DRAFT_34475 [Blyttiomyces helicus]|eukprot:RKO85682.1 hypothetical protein BDK51DRAFT_34475 [Blyttiomyces helicus]